MSHVTKPAQIVFQVCKKKSQPLCFTSHSLVICCAFSI